MPRDCELVMRGIMVDTQCLQWSWLHEVQPRSAKEWGEIQLSKGEWGDTCMAETFWVRLEYNLKVPVNEAALESILSLCLSQVFWGSHVLHSEKVRIVVKPCKRAGPHWILFPSMKSLKSDRYPDKGSNLAIKFPWAGIRKGVPLTWIDCINCICRQFQQGWFPVFCCEWAKCTFNIRHYCSITKTEPPWSGKGKTLFWFCFFFPLKQRA